MRHPTNGDPGASEAETVWTDFLRSLARRGLRGVKLIISDAHQRITSAEAAKLRALGFDFYDWRPGEARLVISWNQSPDDIRPLADAIAGLG